MARRSQEQEHWVAFMRAAQNGDAAAYARLLSDVVPLLREEVRRRRARLQPADREDLVQDILLSLHAARATYDPSRPFLPWLMAIAHNRMVDDTRKYARRASHELAVDKLEETFSAQETNSPAEAYGDVEALRQALDGLPRRQQDAVEMVKLREMSLKEASVASGVTVGALKVAVHRGMAGLRRALGSRT